MEALGKIILISVTGIVYAIVMRPSNQLAQLQIVTMKFKTIGLR